MSNYFERTFGERLASVFSQEQAKLLAEMFEVGFNTLAKASDLSELKAVVKELAEAQRQTTESIRVLAQRVDGLAEVQRRTDEHLASLAEAQRRTDERLEALAEAQRRTDERLEALAEAQRQTEESLRALTQRMDGLAEAQRRTDERLEALAEAQRRTDERLGALAEAQRQTEESLRALTQRMDGLAEAQRQTEESLRALTQRVDRLTEAQEAMVQTMRGIRAELGGLSRSASYALENEAYRNLPALLERELGIKLSSRMIRTEIADEEINVLAFGTSLKDGREVVVVGEAKLQLDRRTGGEEEFERIVEQIWRKVDIVRKEHPDKAVLPILVTHYARPVYVQRAKEQGITLVQSFEW